MKLVREHIYEAFREEGDPIADMGIGLYAPRNFQSTYDVVNYIMEVLYDMYDGEIPENILTYKK